MRILLIEDDQETASTLIMGLKESGYAIDHCLNGREGLSRAQQGIYQILIIDRMLPEMDGLTIVQNLRQQKITVPVLLLSALASVDDRVKGLKAGGDDYLTKPFAFAELLARLEALQRRTNDAESITKLKVADLELDLLTRQVSRDGEVIDLQPREFKLLEFLMKNQGHVVTRSMLMENVWDYHFDPQTNVIDVHISRLRHKIDRDFNKQ
ncbi:MAG: response regulator transcription factor, partial [Candidatus Pacebacteria bacterium]|nr:response regulator transcription factor [Candidatus Paceibacterota bacterium]